MNKLFIGLLMIAAGTGAFLLLRQTSSINKDWIIVQWIPVVTGPAPFK